METTILSVLNRRIQTLERCVAKCIRKLTYQRRLISLIIQVLNSEVPEPILVELDSEEESDDVPMEDLEVPNAQPELIGKYYWFFRL
jgi:hypothetical protein